MTGPRDAARKLADAALQAAREAARERSLDPLRDVVQPGPAGQDRRLARRLAREAEQARLARLQAEQEHAAALARRERVLRRSRRALPPWGVVGAGAVGAAAAAPAVVAPTPVLLTVAAAAGARVLVAVARLRRPPRVPAAPPALPPPAPPPHPRSAAWPAVRRLEHARVELTGLLPLVAPAGRDAAAEAWAVAGEADAALRWQAARLAAAEPHRGPDPVLLASLEDGVAAQERLVQAVADLVAASADPARPDHLQDVTDRLHGLAEGLREVR